ncbi:hypothetical protein BH23GEM1_BH23GEM1_05820 [soil metagenome]
MLAKRRLSPYFAEVETSTSLLNRLDRRDRALFTRWAIGPATTHAVQRFWRIITHLGGVQVTVTAALVPLAFGHDLLQLAAWSALVTLGISHFVVQVMKRKLGRPRPSLGMGCSTFIDEPDRFSCPSGHAAAAMSIAVVYAMTFPAWAAPLLALALAVGASRVFLGVHYPGDVVIGQAIAILTGALVISI